MEVIEMVAHTTCESLWQFLSGAWGLTLGWRCGIVKRRKARLRVVSTMCEQAATSVSDCGGFISYSLSLRYERAAKIVLTMLVVQVTTATIISTIMQAPFNPVFRLEAGRVSGD